MTFYEAALRVLEEAGTPLLSTDITKRAIDKGLLSHVGKTPEITMLLRLAAMARRPRDRRLLVTARDTFALTDWLLPEDAEALAQTGVLEANPEEELPPYRPEERHPEAHAEYLRSLGRQGDRKRRDDDRKKKYPPTSEVAFEALQEGGTALAAGELLARLKAREAVADDSSVGQLIDALASDNQRRLDDGRRPQFAAVRTDRNELQISLEAGGEGGPAPLEIQQAFCAACNLRFENGRVMLKSERRAQERTAESAQSASEDRQLIAAGRTAAKDARRAFARIFRERLVELEQHTFEKACTRLLRALHFHELKVARRAKEGLLLNARRREGSLELRYVVRVLKDGAVERRHVQELRRELSSANAQAALLITTSDARGDVRGECTSGALVQLWAGEALSEKFFEAKLGVTVTSSVEFFDVDEAFFSQARTDAEESLKRREERHREREQEKEQAPVETDAAAPPAAEAAAGEAGDDAEDGQEEGAAGDGRRRKRRRRRRGRGTRSEGEAQAGEGEAPAQAGEPATEPTSADTAQVEAGAAEAAPVEAAAVEPTPEPVAPPEPEAPAPVVDGTGV